MTIKILLYILICSIGAVAVYWMCHTIGHLRGYGYLFRPERKEDELWACSCCGMLIDRMEWNMRAGLCSACEQYWGWPEERRWWHEFCQNHLPKSLADCAGEFEDAGPGIIQAATPLILWLESNSFADLRGDPIKVQLNLKQEWDTFKAERIEDRDKLDWER